MGMKDSLANYLEMTFKVNRKEHQHLHQKNCELRAMKMTECTICIYLRQYRNSIAPFWYNLTSHHILGNRKYIPTLVLFPDGLDLLLCCTEVRENLYHKIALLMI